MHEYKGRNNGVYYGILPLHNGSLRAGVHYDDDRRDRSEGRGG